MSTLRVALSRADHVSGPVDAPARWVEYGDYECPYCGRAFFEVKRAQAMLGERLCFVFRNFPLTRSHPHAEQAAEAAEAAAAQGRFWEMHERLYTHQDALTLDDLLDHARALGLDLPTFEHDVLSRRFQARVHRDLMGGVRSGVNGTPTFFVNETRHEGAFTAEALLDALRDEPAIQDP